LSLAIYPDAAVISTVLVPIQVVFATHLRENMGVWRNRWSHLKVMSNRKIFGEDFFRKSYTDKKMGLKLGLKSLFQTF